MRRAAALVLVLALGACAPRQDSGQTAQANSAPAEPAAPVLLRFQPPERGGPSAYPEAQISGVLDLSGPCVRLHRRRMTTVVSAPGPRVGRDFAGLYIQSGTERLRHGSSVTGGGGWYDALPINHGTLDREVPPACASGPFVIVTGMERYDPAAQPPPRSPPPPPIG